MVEVTINVMLPMAGAVLLAYLSQQHTQECAQNGIVYRKREDPAYLLLIIWISCWAGFRSKFYNDTYAYILIFQNAPGLRSLLSDPANLELMDNPLFYLFINLLKEITEEPRVLIVITSIFTQTCFIWFFKKYSVNFPFSIFLYFTLGTYSVSLGAMKQTLAMGFLCLAFPFAEQKKWLQYYILVFIAFTMHTYAIMLAILPLLRLRPWKAFTYFMVLGLIFVMLNFESTITAVMDSADEAGKEIADYEVFDEHSMNLLRVAVYMVVPLLSLIFQKWLFQEDSACRNMLIHMSIISMAFMIMGTNGGANMFGRMAHYFETSSICILPWILDTVFETKSSRTIAGLATACFLFFFAYSNGLI